MSLQDLADRSSKPKVTKDTIHRLEKGLHKGRRRTLEALAQALRVDPDVLTGEAPMPEEVNGGRTYGPARPMLTRIFPPAHNALALVSWRYGVSRARIVELAPLLFVLAAEGSLAQRRRAMMARSRKATADGLSGEAKDTMEAELATERDSIAARDILGERAPPRAGDGLAFWDNPFAEFLRTECEGLDGIAEFIGFDRKSANYWVCWDDALALAGGDEDIHEWILFAEFMLFDMPKALWAPGAVAERQAWIRSEIDGITRRREEAGGEHDPIDEGEEE